jgi:sugar phosphate isomerase/epimerase
MAVTRTGSFPIGFRRGWSEWQKDLASLVAYAKQNDFAAIDLGAVGAAELKLVRDAGLGVGTVDLKSWGGLIDADAGKRKAAAEENAEHIRTATSHGVKNFFVVMLPADRTKSRKDNFGYAVDGFVKLGDLVAGTGARLAIEGWPGPGPDFPALCCTPADYRAMLGELPTDFGGVNYDASHLIRMGICPLRFLEEFAERVVHVHGKDTEILAEELYEHGNLQPATFAQGHGFGGHHWRYTIPGHGVARFGKMFKILASAGYDGMVCIELEDENFNGSTEGEKRGLEASRDFLKHA